MVKLKTWAAALALALLASAAPAALVLQGNGDEVLDTDTNLLWLYSWRAPVASLKTWDEGNAWAAALTTGGAGAGAWRMPTIDEFQDLWADPAVGGSNAGLKDNFFDVQLTNYWTSTSESADLAQEFSPWTGSGLVRNKGNDRYTVAVRSAEDEPDPRPVPAPDTAALALLALGTAAVARRRRR